MPLSISFRTHDGSAVTPQLFAQAVTAALSGTRAAQGEQPRIEAGVVDLYLKRGVRRVSASAYMELTPMIVRYAASGLTLAPDGSVARKNYVFAKISRCRLAFHTCTRGVWRSH